MSQGPRSPSLAVAALGLVQFIDVLGVTVVVTALPSMLSSLHASPSGSTLIATGYAMFFGGLLMLGARLGDRYGPVAAAVMTFIVGTTIVTQPPGRTAGGLLLVASVVLAGIFPIVDRRMAAPLFPAPLVSQRHLRQGSLGGFLNTAATSSVITLVTLYLQDTLRRTPIEAAATLLPFSLLVIAGSAGSAALQRRWPPQRVIAAGLLIIAVADAALIPAARSPWAVPVCVAAAGLGIGLSSVAATGLGTEVGERWRGGASGIINTAAQLGTALGTAVLLLIASVTSGLPGPGQPLPDLAWGVGAAVAAAGALRFAAIRSRPEIRTPHP